MRTLAPFSVAFAGLLLACSGVPDGNSNKPGGANGTAGGGTNVDPTANGGNSSTGGGATASLVATPRLARLSRLQWENAVRDLLQVEDLGAITSKVTGDPLVGLDNEADALRVDAQLRADLDEASTAMAVKVASDAAALAKLIPSDAPAAGAERAAAFVRSFGARAFRRPLTPAEVTTYQAQFTKGATIYPTDDAFVAGAKLVISTFLQSPHFLYRTELSTEVIGGRVPLNDYEVAAKLALAISTTIPDADLTAAAAAGKLRDRAEVGRQAERLLATAKGGLNVDHLHFQMYRLGVYDGITRNTQTYPDFKPESPAAMREEVLKFMHYIFDQGLGVAGIFTTPVGFVNSTLAPVYGVQGTFGPTLTKVDLDATKRSGLLTLAGYLSSYAVVDDPDSIHRGVFVNERILCKTLPPPDPNATVLKPLDAGMTNRERVEATTGPNTCGQGCHSTVINPPGFAFENFDAIGKYREKDRGKTINAASAYAFDEGVKEFNGPIEFSHLLANSPQAHACYLQNWMGYINGHQLQDGERPTLDAMTQESIAGKLPLKQAVVRIATNDGFLNRLP